MLKYRASNMAGIIDIRYDMRTRRWTARPTFGHPACGFADKAPSAEAGYPAGAVYELCRLLPEDMARRVQLACPQRIYRSPEYNYMDDKCIEVDGHCPRRDEWARRRLAYMRKNNLSIEQYYGRGIYHGK